MNKGTHLGPFYKLEKNSTRQWLPPFLHTRKSTTDILEGCFQGSVGNQCKRRCRCSTRPLGSTESYFKRIPPFLVARCLHCRLSSFFWTLQHIHWTDVLWFIELFTCGWTFMLHSPKKCLGAPVNVFLEDKGIEVDMLLESENGQRPHHGWNSRAPPSLTLTLALCGHHSMVPWGLFCENWGESSCWVRTFCVCVGLWAFRTPCAFITLWSWNDYYRHFTDEKTEAHGKSVICPKS